MSGPGPQPQSIPLRSRRPLMSTCALAAAMVATGYAGTGRSQTAPVPNPSYRATGVANVVNGNATATIAVGTSTTPSTVVTVGNPNSIITWTPTDNAVGTTAPIIFQQGGTATFQSSLDGADYTVLNRIVPALDTATNSYRSISFNGTTTSGADGHIWFFSPGGILAGANAVFNVGSLLLTTQNIQTNSDGSLLGPNGEIRFRDRLDDPTAPILTDSRSAISIDALAQLRAAQRDGSYIALVAPRIAQAGTIAVNGNAALVAGESADITISGNLFDIAVLSGSAVSTPGETVLSHTGTTGNTSRSASPTGPQAVYMVAIPKNDAIAMLVGGEVGFKTATGAQVQDGVVVLSAGRNISSQIYGSSTYPSDSDGPAVGKAASLQISGGTFDSTVLALARTDVTIAPAATGGQRFLSTLDVRAGHDATLTAVAGRTVSVAGSLYLASLGTSDGQQPLAGSARLVAQAGSTLAIGGDAFVSSYINGNATTRDVVGGVASATFTDAAVSIGGSAGGTLQVSAQAVGADVSGPTDPVTAGAGTGGTASISITRGSFTAGALNAYAQGYGGDSGVPANGAGGAGTGGTASIAIDGITPVLAGGTGGVEINADGSGGSAFGPFGVTGDRQGSGTGGTASLTTAATPNSGLTAGNILITATGRGGYDGGEGAAQTIGGAGTGGTATLTSGSGTISGSFITVAADGIGGQGGQASSAIGGDGGAGTGGTATANAQGGSIIATNAIQISASGTGGEGGYDYELGYGTGGSGGAGGVGRGGSATLNIAGKAVTASDISMLAEGRGGLGGGTGGGGGTGNAGGKGGDSQGGTATMSLSGANGSASAQSVTVSGRAFGGDGGEGDTAGGNGGNATGGTALLSAVDSAVSGGTILVSTDGNGGNGGDSNGPVAGGSGGNGTAGSSTLTVATDPVTPGNGGTITPGTSLDIRSVGTGGAGGNHVEFGYGAGGSGGNGGAGVGKTATLNVTRGSVAGSANGSAPLVNVISDGLGGSAGDYLNFGGGADGPGGSGGSGSAGVATATMGANAANRLTASTFTVSAIGTGTNAGSGAASSASSGGAGTSGTAQLLANGGQFGATTTQILASSTGGNGNGGAGGNAGSTGSATIQAQDTQLALGTYTIEGGATGGDGGDASTGGNATAGGAVLSVTRGTVSHAGGVNLNASADGGYGGAAAGSGTGGVARYTIASAQDLGASSAINVHADGRAGTTSTAGVGGAGKGGTATLDIAGITIAPTIDLSANGSGTQGGSLPGSGSGGTAAFTASGGATVDLGATTASIAAIGTGGNATQAPGIGGAGTGGSTAIVASGATIAGTGLLALRSQGIGGSAIDNGTAGAGTGGSSRVTITQANGVDGGMAFGSALIDSGGTGGLVGLSGVGGLNGGIGGAGTGGTSLLDVQAGTFRVTGATTISIAGVGGASRTSGTGGAGTGGAVTIRSGGNGGAPTSGVIDLAAFTVNGRGSGGAVSEDGYGVPAGGTGGAGTGGTLAAALGAGSFSADATSFDFSGQGGAGGASTGAAAGGVGGAGTGGTVTFTETGTLGDATSFTVDVRGVGGAGGSSTLGNGGAGGRGQGGSSTVGVGGAGATLALTSFSGSAGGTGGGGGSSGGAATTGGAGGAAQGGTSRVAASAGGTFSTTAATVLDAGATGGIGGSSSGTLPTGAGGGAIAGTTELATQGGTIRVAGASLQSNAAGGTSARGVGGAAGNAAHDGAARLTVNGGTLAINGPLTASATTTGGSGASRGGDAFGGTTALALSNGATFTYSGAGFTLASQATGGNSTATAGVAGSAEGGSATILVDGPTTMTFTAPVSLVANGVAAGSTGGPGGNGTGGTATVVSSNGATINFNAAPAGPTALSMQATGAGGGGQTGGIGRGGTASITATGATISVPGAVVMATSGSGGAASGAGNGGAGTGGTSTVSLLPTATRGGTIGAGTLAANSNGVGGTLRAGSAFTPVRPTGVAGTGTGGGIVIDAQSGTLTVTGATTLSANGIGGDSQGDGTGGAGIGGGAAGSGTRGIAISTGGGPFPGTLALADVQASATGIGGTHTEVGYGAITGTAGGAGRGGAISVTSGSGAIGATSLSLDAHGSGGSASASDGDTNGKAGGAGTGGTVALASTGGALSAAGLSIDVTGSGGFGASGLNGGAGGAGIGGSASIEAGDSVMSLAAVIDAYGLGGDGGSGANFFDGGEGFPVARGGDGGAGGAATGGTVAIGVSGPNGVLTLTSPLLQAYAQGGSGGRGGIGSTGGSGARGGDATGGAIDLGASAGSLSILGAGEGGSIFDAHSLGGNGGTGGSGASADSSGGIGGGGGDAMRGTARITVGSGTILAESLSLQAYAQGGDGGFGGDGGEGSGAVGNGGSGGNATGGLAALIVGSGSISADSLFLNADGIGGAGRGSGAAGGNGIGGTASIGADSDPGFTNLTMHANGIGGEGGYGAIGGNGGDGTGGRVDLATAFAALSIGTAELQANGIGGDGGEGFAGNGGNGGAGTGGLTENGGGITITARGTGGTLAIGTLTANADGSGGNGAAGSTSAAGVGGSGGSGGTARGGNVLLTAVDGGVFGGPDGPNSATLSASAFGGQAGTSSAGTIGGAGGNGGSATGGTTEILADGGSITILGIEDSGPTLNADAVGGDGTAGSDGSNVGNTGGLGGNGGDGIGGTARITVTGGTLAAGRTSLSATGTSGVGEQGGFGAGTPAIPGDPTANPPVPPVPPGPPTYAGGGSYGAASGGLVSINVGDGNDGQLPGTASLGDTSINSSGSVAGIFDGGAGRVEIYDSSTATEPTLTLNSLDIANYGNVSGGGEAVDIFADDTRITVGQFATINTGGSANFRATGRGGLDVGTSLFGSAGGDIIVTHDNQPDPRVDTIHAGSIDLRTASNFDAQLGSVIRADGSMYLDAAGTLAADRLYGGDLISATARGNVTIDTAIASAAAFDGGEGGTGTPGGGRVLISAGREQESDLYRQSDVTVTGEVGAPGSVEIDAGQDVIVASGAKILSDNRVTIAAGDDVLVQSGAEVRAALDPIETLDDNGPGETLDPAARLSITAGRLARNYEPATGEVASILVDGTLSAAARPVFLAGGAIVADANPIVARSLIVEVDGAPAPGAVQFDDNGQLTRTDCLQGDVCLGNLQFDRLLSIGGAIGTTAFLPTRLRIAGDAGAQVTSLRAQGDITVGQRATPADIGATVSGGDLLVQSTQGSILLLGGSTLTGGDGPGGQFRVLAAGDVTGGSLAAFGDAQLGIGGNLNVTGLSAGGGLVTLDQAGAVSATNLLRVGGGSIQIGTLSLGDGDANLIGPAGISVGTAEVADGRSINFLSTGGTVSLLAAGPSTRGTPTDIVLDGRAVTAGSLSAANDVLLRAQGSLGATSLTAGRDVVATAGGATDIAAIRAGRTATVNSGGTFGFTTIDSAGSVLATASGITGQRISAGTDLTVRGQSAATGAPIRIATLISGGATNIDNAGVVAIDSITAGTDIFARALVSLDFRALKAGRNIDIQTRVADATAALPRTITVDTATAGGDLYLGTFGALAINSATTTGTGTLFLGSSTSIRAGTVNGARDVTLFMSPTSPSGITIADGRGGIEVTTLTAGGNFTATNLASGLRLGTVTVGGNSTVTLSATDPLFGGFAVDSFTGGGNIALNTTGTTALGTTRAGGTLGVTAGGAITGTSATANGITLRGARVALPTLASSGNLAVSSTAGAIAIDRATATGNADLDATGGTLAVANLAAGGTVNARGTAVTLAGQGPLTIGTITATSGGIGVQTAGALSVATASSTGTTRLTSTAGTVAVQNASTTLTAGDATRGDIIVNAALDAQLNGTVSARDDVSVTAGQTATVNGQTTGKNVALASADIAVGSAATIGGGAGTTSVTFTNNRGGTRTFIGDTTGTGGYRLDNVEFGKVRAQTIQIAAPGSTTATDTPDVTIGTLTIGGSATAAGQTANLFGSNAGLIVTTPGTLRLAGNVRLVSAGAADRIDLGAGSRLDMITPDSSLVILDAANAPTGRLNLTASNILVSSTQAAQALATLTTLDAKSDRLGTNDGAIKPEGYIQAGGITFRVGNSLFVQNSGTTTTSGRQPDLRAGLTVGSGGISIVTTGTQPAQIAINGRQTSATAVGGFVTGQALIPVLALSGGQGTASFDPRSTANGCLILGQSCGFDPGSGLPPIQDVINEYNGASDSGTGLVQAFNVPIIEMIDIDTYGFTPSIDEPVTGAGNDDLWTTDCTDVTAQTPCPQEGTGPQPTQ